MTGWLLNSRGISKATMISSATAVAAQEWSLEPTLQNAGSKTVAGDHSNASKTCCFTPSSILVVDSSTCEMSRIYDGVSGTATVQRLDSGSWDAAQMSTGV